MCGGAVINMNPRKPRPTPPKLLVLAHGQASTARSSYYVIAAAVHDQPANATEVLKGCARDAVAAAHVQRVNATQVHKGGVRDASAAVLDKHEPT